MPNPTAARYIASTSANAIGTDKKGVSFVPNDCITPEFRADKIVPHNLSSGESAPLACLAQTQEKRKNLRPFESHLGNSSLR
jgi:hypothetical protein